MASVMIKDKYLESLSALGDVQSAVDTALERYTIEQIKSKLIELRRREEVYETKYGMQYSTFEERAGQDERFIQQVEANISKTWELDLADWEFCHKGIQDWKQRLQMLSRESSD